MSRERSDSDVVARFLSQFAKLKAWCDDDPDSLEAFAKDDESVERLCHELFWSASAIRHALRSARSAYIAPVNPAFKAAWREFEERYDEVVDTVLSRELGLMLFDGDEGALRRIEAEDSRTQAEKAWEKADQKAESDADAVEDALTLAESESDPEHNDYRWAGDDSLEMFFSSAYVGTQRWTELKTRTGFDLRGVFRRLDLVPMILLPRHVAKKYGSDDRLTLLGHLQKTRDAFVFGAYEAALSLMRSVLEATLRDLYRVDCPSLCDAIDRAKPTLPQRANAAALHTLRRRANSILHLDHETDAKLPSLDALGLEKELVWLLYVLRELIEAAPPRLP